MSPKSLTHMYMHIQKHVYICQAFAHIIYSYAHIYINIHKTIEKYNTLNIYILSISIN